MSQQSDHLDDEIDDGGGCLEAAHAASDTRTRRSALKGAVTTLIGMGVIPTATASQPTDSRVESEDGDGEGGRYPDPEDVVIETPPEAERARVLSNALTNDDVDTLRQYFIEQGWSPTGERVIKTVVDNTTETDYYTVVLEFNTDEEDTTAHIIYNSLEEHASGLYEEHVDLSGDGENDHFKVTAYTVENGTVVTETDTIENFLGCNDVNVRCVAAIASTHIGTIAACASCGATSGVLVPACGACVSTAIARFGATLCEWCKD